MAEVLHLAIVDLERKNEKKSSAMGQADAAKWILGIGSEQAGMRRGLSIDDVAQGLGVTSEWIQDRSRAKEKLAEFLEDKARRKLEKVRLRRTGLEDEEWGGASDGV